MAGWDWGAIGAGAASFATGGISNAISNGVTAISEGRPLDALSGVIVGGTTGAIVGAAQVGAGVISGATGDPTALQTVQGIQKDLNTFGGAMAFAGTALAIGGALGGGSALTDKLTGVLPGATKPKPGAADVAAKPAAPVDWRTEGALRRPIAAPSAVLAARAEKAAVVQAAIVRTAPRSLRPFGIAAAGIAAASFLVWRFY